MGGLSGAATSGATSTARDPAVRRTGADKGTQTRGSSPRPPSRKPTTAERAVYSATGNLARDLTMGLSTFGQSKERQAETLRSKGYSDDVIKSYQERSAASMARALAEEKRTSKDDKPAAVTSTTTDTTTTTGTTTTAPPRPDVPTTPTPPPAPPDIGTDTVVDTGADTTYRGGNVDVGDVVDNRVVTSETEAEAIESTGKGRRSTIATSPKGLLGTGSATRPRRSLVGGGLIR